jgi:hypothetical protein
LGCNESALKSGDAQRDASVDDDDVKRLEREGAFWEPVAICGEWVEEHPTIATMANAADAVVLGRVDGVTAGRTVQGGPQDFYAETNLVVDVDEVLRNTIPARFELSLVLPRVITPEAVEPAVKAMQENLPEERLVLLVRARSDVEGLYRLMSDKALWTRTTRAVLDNPIAENDCSDHWGEAVQKRFLGDVQKMDELIQLLRP